MPAYVYECVVHGEFEEIHSIKDKLEKCPSCEKNGVTTSVKRLIAPTSFVLANGGVGWAKQNYGG